MAFSKMLLLLKQIFSLHFDIQHDMNDPRLFPSEGQFQLQHWQLNHMHVKYMNNALRGTGPTSQIEKWLEAPQGWELDMIVLAVSLVGFTWRESLRFH